MNEVKKQATLLRSILAIGAGLLTIIVLSTATDLVMHSTGIFPPVGQPMADWLFVIALIYRIVYGILGSYITARLATHQAMTHALILGTIGFVLSVIGAVVMWDAGPAWYSLGVAAIPLPCAWTGGRLHSS